jgi:hypothetical protein
VVAGARRGLCRRPCGHARHVSSRLLDGESACPARPAQGVDAHVTSNYILEAPPQQGPNSVAAPAPWWSMGVWRDQQPVDPRPSPRVHCFVLSRQRICCRSRRAGSTRPCARGACPASGSDAISASLGRCSKTGSLSNRMSERPSTAELPSSRSRNRDDRCRFAFERAARSGLLAPSPG